MARRKATRPITPGIWPRKSNRSLGQQRCFGGGRVRFPVIANTVTFTGRRLDDETGLFYYRNRYYHAQLGRFVSRDPAAYEGGDRNLYAYVNNSPAVLQDPSGLSASSRYRLCGVGKPLGITRTKKLTRLTVGTDILQAVKAQMEIMKYGEWHEGDLHGTSHVWNMERLPRVPKIKDW